MVGIYLSGTGNTKHCLEKLLKLVDEKAEAIPIENERAINAIKENDVIIYAYPTQFSNAPIMVRDFIRQNGALWQGKKIICFTTMGLMSGDGTGCTARIFRKYGAKVIGGLQIRMPDAVCDEKALKKSEEDNLRLIEKADRKIEKTAMNIKAGKCTKTGLRFSSHIMGLFCQRLWYYGKTKYYRNDLKFNEQCKGCGLCVRNCPMKNLSIKDGIITQSGKCTMCYRCISSCPQKAITLLGDKVVEQCRYENYIK